VAVVFDWSMTMLGYPAHQLSGVPVVGVSHMSTHAALRFAESIGCYTGWLQADGQQAQLDGLVAGKPTWVALAELFVEGRIANTEGVVSGDLHFAAAVPANGEPPGDRSLEHWAESGQRLWLRVIDNEFTYFGGLDDGALERLLCWFISQRPLDESWQDQRIDPKLVEELIDGLFAHGWSRNYSLVRHGRKPTVELWGGAHARCVLQHQELHRLGAVNHGMQLSRRSAIWKGAVLDRDCPLNDETGRLRPRPTG